MQLYCGKTGVFIVGPRVFLIATRKQKACREWNIVLFAHFEL